MLPKKFWLGLGITLQVGDTGFHNPFVSLTFSVCWVRVLPPPHTCMYSQTLLLSSFDPSTLILSPLPIRQPLCSSHQTTFMFFPSDNPIHQNRLSPFPQLTATHLIFSPSISSSPLGSASETHGEMTATRWWTGQEYLKSAAAALAHMVEYYGVLFKSYDGIVL